MTTATMEQARKRPVTKVPLVSKPKGKMGRRLESLDTPLPPGLRGQFCKRFRKIVAERGVSEVATATGLSVEFVRKIVAGDRMPGFESWPELAKKLGLSHWTDFFDQKPASR